MKFSGFSALLMASVFPLLGQAKKTAPKPFVPPKPYYVLDPVLAKDSGCAKDYVKLRALEGVNLRKGLADVITYGCIESVDGFFRVFSRESEDFLFQGEHISLRHVHLIREVSIAFPSDRITAEGWLAADKMVQLSDDELRTYVKSVERSIGGAPK